MLNRGLVALPALRPAPRTPSAIPRPQPRDSLSGSPAPPSPSTPPAASSCTTTSSTTPPTSPAQTKAAAAPSSAKPAAPNTANTEAAASATAPANAPAPKHNECSAPDAEPKKRHQAHGQSGRENKLTGQLGVSLKRRSVCRGSAPLSTELRWAAVARLTLEDVFKIGGVPTYTFVEPSEYARLRVALRTPGRGLIVEGPSGIGKSTAVTRALESLGVHNEVQALTARDPKDVGLIELLPTMNDFGVAVVDDFHVLDHSVRRDIADLLKRLADTESPASKLIIVGINRAGDSLIESAPDLANRLDVIRFEVEPPEKVRELIEAGEQAFNVDINARERIVEGSQGSFYLAQLLCHELCTEAAVTESPEERTTLNVSYQAVRDRVLARQARRFGHPVMAFARGPRFRPGGRANYLHILGWLKDAESWAISLPEEMARHPSEKASVSQVVEKGYLASATSQEQIARLMHYDSTTKILSVEDPQLVFYLRNLDWAQFVRTTGYTRVEVEEEYDFALSFAGEDRPFAERLKDHLGDLEVSVFYDMSQQHQILAENLEEFLGPIYSSKAAYVIAILGPQYGERRWTRFESEQFEELFGANRVIPVWSTKAKPTAFDTTRDIGGASYDPDGDLDLQAKHIAELCARKLDAVAAQTSLL